MATQMAECGRHRALAWISIELRGRSRARCARAGCDAGPAALLTLTLFRAGASERPRTRAYPPPPRVDEWLDAEPAWMRAGRARPLAHLTSRRARRTRHRGSAHTLATGLDPAAWRIAAASSCCASQGALRPSRAHPGRPRTRRCRAGERSCRVRPTFRRGPPAETHTRNSGFGHLPLGLDDRLGDFRRHGRAALVVVLALRTWQTNL